MPGCGPATGNRDGVGSDVRAAATVQRLAKVGCISKHNLHLNLL